MAERISAPRETTVVRALQVDLEMGLLEARVELVAVGAAKRLEEADRSRRVFKRPAALIGKVIQREREMQPERHAQPMQTPRRNRPGRVRRNACGEKIA